MKYYISSSTNYRDISLFIAMGKVMQYYRYLTNFLSHWICKLFFKQEHSTVMCSLLYHEVMYHHL